MTCSSRSPLNWISAKGIYFYGDGDYITFTQDGSCSDLFGIEKNTTLSAGDSSLFNDSGDYDEAYVEIIDVEDGDRRDGKRVEFLKYYESDKKERFTPIENLKLNKNFHGFTLNDAKAAVVIDNTEYDFTIKKGVAIEEQGQDEDDANQNENPDGNDDGDVEPQPVDPEESGKFIEGTSRKDKLTGTKYDDDIYGYGGNDKIKGKGGDDLIDAGKGRKNVAKGGSGEDTFVLNKNARVIIKDFDPVEDAISLDGAPGRTSYQQRGNNFYFYDNDGDSIAKIKGVIDYDSIDLV